MTVVEGQVGGLLLKGVTGKPPVKARKGTQENEGSIPSTSTIHKNSLYSPVEAITPQDNR